MSVEQIKVRSRARFRENGGNCFSLSMFLFSIAGFLFVFFSSVRLIFEQVGWEKYFSLRALRYDGDVMIFWAIIMLLMTPLVVGEWWVINRLFVDISRGEDFVETKKYLNAHVNIYGFKALLLAIDILLRKFIMLIPALIGGYGIYYLVAGTPHAQLSSLKLLLLMLCIGFTGVWLGIFFRYIISLAMVNQIMLLNPRAKISKAVALSKKLMEGNHMKYFVFHLTFVKFIPLFILIYPFFVVYPYYKTCKVTLSEEILGDYWQDKLKASVRRWRRYSL